MGFQSETGWLKPVRFAYMAMRHRVPYRISRPFLRSVKYLISYDLHGMCYAMSCASYVAFCEADLDPVLRLGKCSCSDGPDPGVPFDHCWIELEHRPVDAAIALPIGNPGWERGPVLYGIDLDTGLECDIIYDLDAEPGRDIVTLLDMGFHAYMDWYPREPHGLWSVAAYLIGRKSDPISLRERYADLADPLANALHERSVVSS